MALPANRKHLIRVPRGHAREAASFLAQMDDQSRRMLDDLKRVRPAELAWQPRPGMNSMGMLLAHIAIVEVYWLLIADERMTHDAVRKVLGIGVDDDGMPLPPGRRPPAALRGKTLAFYRALLGRARAFAKRTARWPDADLDRVVTRRRRDGMRSKHNVRWILYHVLEHEAGHYGQILLLRHLYGDRSKP
ncbi:MAG TPA: DinB family protein [Candidatus Eisenbacteria bacterium]|jgi:uncharacterized damage-inducible protein DinB